MAKTRSPLFSSSARGKLARSLVYSNKKSGQLTRAMHYPKKEPSLKQWTRRHIVGLLTAHWQCMADDEHNTWNANAAASGLNLPGYQYFLKSAQADLYSHHGLVAYFSFNEASGESVYCHVCDMIIGVLEPSYPDNCPVRTSSLRTEYGNALLFDGVDDQVEIDYNPRFNLTTQATFEAWINLDNLTHGMGTVFGNWHWSAGNKSWQLRISNDYLQFFYSNDGTTTSSLNATTRMITEWSHVVVRLDLDNNINFFINGVLDPASAVLVSLYVLEQQIFIGSLRGYSRFKGKIDEVRVYRRALSDEEIKKHYQLLRLDKKRQPLLRL